MTRSAHDIVHDYIHKVWDQLQVELITEICANPITRHDAEKRTTLTHQEQISRIAATEEHGFRFIDVVLYGESDYVTSVWNLVAKDQSVKHCGIEIFKVEDGRITDVWNSTYMAGHWG